jgi:two-component system, chemotaxis family, response regulator Rcp1
MEPHVKPLGVLLVEDNPADILLTKKALENIGTHLDVARDGEEAMQYLKKEAGFSGALTPDIIVLDLNLPRLDGREVLGEIKKDPLLRKIPVVILTSSEAESDITQTYDLHANCYIVKPVEGDKFMQVLENINQFWLDTVRLPSTRKH